MLSFNFFYLVHDCVLGLLRSLLTWHCLFLSGPYISYSSVDPEGETGGPDPPLENHQVIWVFIGNKQLDPLWKRLDPPGKCWTPSGTLKNDRFI